MNDKEKLECTAAIDTFLDGSCGEHDGDDSISIQSENQGVQLIKNYCADSNSMYPPDKPGHWCNDQGTEKLSQLSNLIKSGSENNVRSFVETEMRNAEQNPGA